MNGYLNYVAVCKCGVCVGATVDDPFHKRQVAKEVHSWIREGLTVQRENDDFVRAFFGKCRCKEVEAHPDKDFGAGQASLFDEAAQS